GRILDLDAEAAVLVKPLFAGDTTDVVVDLRLGREGRAPLGVRREAERVEVTRHVARAAGIGVVAPGAGDVVRALEDHEVVVARALQFGGDRKAGEARADDCDASVRVPVHPLPPGYGAVTYISVSY